MTNEQPVTLNTPVPDTPSTIEANKEVVLKEDYIKERIGQLREHPFDIILPDEVKVKEKKKPTP